MSFIFVGSPFGTIGKSNIKLAFNSGTGFLTKEETKVMLNGISGEWGGVRGPAEVKEET